MITFKRKKDCHPGYKELFMFYNIKTCCAFLTERAFCCLVTSSELQQMWVFLDELPSYLKAIIPWKWSQDVFLFLVSLYSTPSCFILTDREVGGWEWSRNKFPWPLYPPTITSSPSYHLSSPNRTPCLTTSLTPVASIKRLIMDKTHYDSRHQ